MKLIRGDTYLFKVLLKNITLDEINLVYNTFYHPSNMFLTVTGNFDPEYLSVVIKENQNNKELPLGHFPLYLILAYRTNKLILLLKYIIWSKQ